MFESLEFIYNTHNMMRVSVVNTVLFYDQRTAKQTHVMSQTTRALAHESKHQVTSRNLASATVLGVEGI